VDEREGKGEMKMYQWVHAKMELTPLQRSYIKWENALPRAGGMNGREENYYKIMPETLKKRSLGNLYVDRE
jgi:hypothetical protein